MAPRLYFANPDLEQRKGLNERSMMEEQVLGHHLGSLQPSACHTAVLYEALIFTMDEGWKRWVTQLIFNYMDNLCWTHSESCTLTLKRVMKEFSYNSSQCCYSSSKLLLVLIQSWIYEK